MQNPYSISTVDMEPNLLSFVERLSSSGGYLYSTKGLHTQSSFRLSFVERKVLYQRFHCVTIHNSCIITLAYKFTMHGDCPPPADRVPQVFLVSTAELNDPHLKCSQRITYNRR